ncbi:rhomboid family intramembrane serine protease [Flavobacterium magnum]|uniref:Rhomboid family intramembrane serine protease n=1 Tax=Flavobacterium magnum TaxID=2162713 RepID=A0A2S0RID4_9FLAO|nr:rhomboid family intramembrane serine protease [Flavobacterium magnum]AWA31436.1 rhomboid family intramembrane serine protease [Flavobacterium magnum]
MNNMTPVVKQLLIINIIVFIGAQLMGGNPIEANAAYRQLSLFYFENPNFKIWQPVTSMFMHAPFPNIMHIAFNMIALVSFGSMLEHFWGGTKFLIFYFVCGLGAFLMHTGVNYYFYHEGVTYMTSLGLGDRIPEFLSSGTFKYPTNISIDNQVLGNMIDAYNGTAVGASGAIYGLLVAFAFMFPMAELALFFIPVPIKAKYFVPGLIAVDLFLGLKGSSLFGDNSGGGIAHFAHIGGALLGFIMMMSWRKNKFQNNRWN